MTDAQAVAFAAQLGASVFPADLTDRLNAIAAALRQLDLVSAYVENFSKIPRL